MTLNRTLLAAMIDHTCLDPSATATDIGTLCAEAVEHGFGAVCVAPARVAQAVRILADEAVRVVTVAGFPHGSTIPRAKLLEAQSALELGADEIDMVMQVGMFKDGADVIVHDEIARIADAVHAAPDRICKVIVETALLSGDEIARACGIAVDAGADFVKTSTGFARAGATYENVRLMHMSVAGRAGVKAAGGIRDYATAVAMVEAGATRLGASASVAIVGGAPE